MTVFYFSDTQGNKNHRTYSRITIPFALPWSHPLISKTSTFSASESETRDCCHFCPLPVAQAHKAGADYSCSNKAAGHNELEEFSQRNSFAYFCFGCLRECFCSALADGFQTEGTLGYERGKAVTHCARCQGMAVTHGSWQGPCAPRPAAAEPPSPPRDPPPWPRCPSTLAQRGDHQLCSQPAQRGQPRGQAAGSAASPDTSLSRQGELPGPGSHRAQPVPGRRHAAGAASSGGAAAAWVTQSRGGRGVTGPRCVSVQRPFCRSSYSQHSLPGALGSEAVRSDPLELFS